MAVIDRDLKAIPSDVLDTPVVRDTQGPRPPWSVTGPGVVLLASLSAAAGVIHLSMVPSHARAWLAEGLAFAAVGWLQLGLAAVFLGRASRAALRVAALTSAACIAAWAVTRVWGPPFGPHSGVPEDVSLVDSTSVALEALLIVAVLAFSRRPAWGTQLGRRALTGVHAAAVGLLAITTAVLVSPSSANHAHRAAGAAVAGHDHGAAPVDGATPADDLGLSEVMNGQGAGGGHTHDVAEVALDPATQQALDAQLAQTQLLIEQYPTVRHAEAAGYFRAGPFSPGLGAHYNTVSGSSLNTDGNMDPDDLARPMLIYDGIEPDSPIAGFMYMSYSLDTERAPEGFAGPNDHWHYHTNVCITFRADGGIDAPLGADTTATQELCDEYGGTLIANTGYMAHVWTVPGYESPQGTFSNVNARITCEDGTYHTIEPEDIGYRTTTCLDA